MTNEPNSFYFFWGGGGRGGCVKESFKKKNSVIPFQLPKRCLLKTLNKSSFQNECANILTYIYVFQ